MTLTPCAITVMQWENKFHGLFMQVRLAGLPLAKIAQTSSCLLLVLSDESLGAPKPSAILFGNPLKQAKMTSFILKYFILRNSNL